MPNWSLFIPAKADFTNPKVYTWLVIGIVIGGVLF